ncbi:MAG: acyl-CoA dehydratase activase-related protein [Vallitaleaceae bacterium]|jgi:predicted CoA-substrate-specific enzyme activase|nr:acyl-CoA dehydratase activase-related protein [Vallitaleaceae bacterium]
MYIGIDIGSTTVKVVLVNELGELISSDYRRHYADVKTTTFTMVKNLTDNIKLDTKVQLAITGSAGLGISKAKGLPFVQEVFATQLAMKTYLPEADVVIEIGGEDAKIIFISGGLEYRMNGTCAGGTGAFIDQMATLMDLTLDELDACSMRHDKIYTIASRCGVFAKSDIQPLLNQGASKDNIAASIHQAVVDQTVTGLAQGRIIKGKVAFLGGPLKFSKGLQERFVESLKLDVFDAIFPENAEYYVGLGAALYAKNEEGMTLESLLKRLEAKDSASGDVKSFEPLFENHEAYDAFIERHSKHDVPRADISSYVGDAYLGIDAGSTTTKMVLLDEDNNILFEFYDSNKGNPLDIITTQLGNLYNLTQDRIRIRSSAVVGYGEDLIKTAFSLDYGLVETVAHYTAAKHFNPNVTFILDIGGQDIKCFHIKEGAIDSIMLNEACSSGCGSFIETYAKALDYNVADFAQIALDGKSPVDLGSRCTVFMNSSIKQAQKEGVDVADISAGLSISVIKNALYKVIRANSAEELGDHIVVQGGTFYNDAILRSFELEIKRDVIRPSIAGLMGAFGAALYAKELKNDTSNMITKEALIDFNYNTNNVTCNLCTNHCQLTVNKFNDGTKYISGNRCERPYTKGEKNEIPNLFESKLKYLTSLESKSFDKKIGLPLGLNFYELLPFWTTFFNELGYEVVHSGTSTREVYTLGQHTIPSDTACYPAKLMHGHIEKLLDQGISRIFYPCMTYNLDEKIGDNHYNCPVVAYYPELLDANVGRLSEVEYYRPYIGLHRPKDFIKKMYVYFKDKLDVTEASVKKASNKAYLSQATYRTYIQDEGQKAINYARERGMKMVVLSGRPYHIDPEINHGIDELIKSFDIVVLSEDAVAHLVDQPQVNVLNQWTYHSRMYNAAKYVTMNKDMEFVQLVSFGCGTDAITTDEIRHILEIENRLYTQLKIDEINNLGAARIRIRTLIAASEAKERMNG